MTGVIVWPVLRDIKAKLLSDLDTIYVFGRTGGEVIAVTKDDNAYAFGLNNSRCLGLGHNWPVKEPTIVPELCQKRIKTITSGLHAKSAELFTFAVALTKFGQLYAWGSSVHEREGAVDEKPKLIEALKDEYIVDVCCGSSHCLALTQSGDVYVWGYNKSWQCGTGDRVVDHLTPTKVGVDGHKIVSIVCGGSHSLVLTESGELYGWGCNENGQLGVENRFQRSPLKMVLNENIVVKKVSAGFDDSIILSTVGDVYIFNRSKQIAGQVLPMKLSIGFKIVDILSNSSFKLSLVKTEHKKCYRLDNLENPIELPETTIYDAYNRLTKLTVKPVAIKQFLTPRKSVSEKLGQSFDNQKYSDIAFKIDGKYIYAQKLLLRCICKHFDHMFGDNIWRESTTNEIEITQYSYSVFYAFLKYLHTNSFDIDFDEILDLLDLANSYFEDDLKNECIEFIKRFIDIQNVCHFYCVAVKYDLKDLEEFCFDFASIDIKKVFKTKGFNEMTEIPMRNFFIRFGNYASIQFAKLK